MPGIMRLLYHHLLPAITPSTRVKQRKQPRNKKENNIHYPKRKRRLQHIALFISREVETVDRCRSEDAETDLVGGAGGYGGAVLMGDAAEFVDGGDEGAEEEEVDESDEAGGGGGAGDMGSGVTTAGRGCRGGWWGD